MKRKALYAAGVLLALLLAGCGSYSPGIEDSAENGNDVIKDHLYYVVMTNVLLSKDRLPASYTDLASISQTNSASASVGFTWPFGPLHGTTGRLTASPTASLSTTPSGSIISLNNTGFVVAMMTPVNPLFLLSRWDSDSQPEARKRLLSLFVKSIEFPANAPTDVPPILYNDPTNTANLAKFNTFIDALLGTDGTGLYPKIVTVMEPLGKSFVFSSPPTSPATALTQDLSGLSLATGLSDGQFHVGNTNSGANGILYHSFPAQIALCSPHLGLAMTAIGVTAAVPTLTESAKRVAHIELMQVQAAKGGGAPPSPTSPSPSSGAPPGTATAATPSAQLSQALNVNRFSALTGMDQDCKQDEIVADTPTDETTFAKGTAAFVRVEWRSPDDVIQYLGAWLRQEGQAVAPDCSTDESKVTDDEIFDVSNVAPSCASMKIAYGGPDYYFSGKSLQALEIAARLVNMSKLASGTQISQPVLFIP